jgi:PPOX class probable F420-dependent enzyme
MSDTALTPTARLRRAAVLLNKRVLTALRSPESATVVDLPPGQGNLGRLRGHDHCLVVSYRRDGRPVAQPVWPGYDGDRVYLWTEARAAKVLRLRRNPAALIAPCTFRGRPLDAPIAATARILETEPERRHAAEVLRSQWGWKRRTFEWLSRPLSDVVYIELTAA